MLKHTSAAGIGALLAPSMLSAAQSDSAQALKIIVAGAHPDDPETGCGGTIKLLAAAGHQVVVYYLTRGEAGIDGLSHAEAAMVRTREAEQACRILGAKPVFGRQIDAETELNEPRYDEILEFVHNEQPDVVLTHWPIDTHPDHRVCSLLFYHAWLNSSKPFDLYYYEVMTGHQTQNFSPTIFIDISSIAEIKHRACFVHRSQKIEESYHNDHGLMEKFRGLHVYSEYAEAFVQQLPNEANVLSKAVEMG